MNAEAMREEMLRLTAFRSIAATIPARPITESPYARWVAREAEALERERQRLQAGLHVRLDGLLVRDALVLLACGTVSIAEWGRELGVRGEAIWDLSRRLSAAGLVEVEGRFVALLGDT